MTDSPFKTHVSSPWWFTPSYFHKYGETKAVTINFINNLRNPKPPIIYIEALNMLVNTSLDIEVLMNNAQEGIKEYLDHNTRKYGKIYVTPFGVFSVLKQLEELSGCYRKTLLRRFQSRRKSLSNYYVITSDTPLQPPEDCEYTDAWDDFLEDKDCWLDRIHRDNHGEPLKGTDKFSYLYKGNMYQETISRFRAGYYPHKET